MQRKGYWHDKTASRSAQIGHFLQTRRAKLGPADVGMPDAGRRRTPGLRREEVAVLAGVSVSWYTWLEQGRNINISPDLLASIGEALKLDRGELEYLFRLANLLPEQQDVEPFSTSRMTSEEVQSIQELVEALSPNPAFAQDKYWNVVAANRVAIEQLHMCPGPQNLLEDIFVFSGSPSRYPQGANLQRRYAARLRVDLSKYPKDERLSNLVSGLAASSGAFRKLWELHEILDDDRPYRVQVQVGEDERHFSVRRLLLARNHGVWIVVLLPLNSYEDHRGTHRLAGVR